MPVLNTDVIVNMPLSGSPKYTEAVVNIVNNSNQTMYIYMAGQSIDGAASLFAQIQISLEPAEVFTQAYPTNTYWAFQFIFYMSILIGNVDVTLISADGTMVTAALQPIALRRITSEFQQLTTTPLVGVPSISYRRKSIPPFPQAASATITPQGFDIVATDVFNYQIVLGGAVDGTFVDYPTSSTAIPTDQTDLQVNTSATTITGGQVIFQGMGCGLSGAYQTTTVNLYRNELLANLLDNQNVTLVITSLDVSDNLAITFRMLEQW